MRKHAERPLFPEDRRIRAVVERWLGLPRPDLPLPPEPEDPALIEAIGQLRAAWAAADMGHPEMGPQAFWTYSVWQAELVLWDIQRQFRTLADPLEIRPGRYLHPVRQAALRPLFRGEPFDKADSHIRPLTSSARRRAVPEERIVRLNQLFARIVDHVIAPTQRYGVEVLEMSWWAVARHYGMPSTLLDLTVDPSVAVHFADRTTSHQAAVYWIPAEWCIERGLRILFPPPPCDRLYLQRGVLLDTTGLAEGELLEHASLLVFPPSGHHRVIRPVPAGLSRRDYWGVHAPRVVEVEARQQMIRGLFEWRHWLGKRQEGHWFERVVKWVQQNLDEVDHGPRIDIPSLSRQVVRSVGSPRFLEGTSWEAYATALTTLLVWTAGYEVRQGSYALDPAVRAQLVRDNAFLEPVVLPWMAAPQGPHVQSN